MRVDKAIDLAASISGTPRRLLDRSLPERARAALKDAFYAGAAWAHHEGTDAHPGAVDHAFKNYVEETDG